MTNLEHVQKMIAKHWMAELRGKTLPLPPEAKFVTGRKHDDAHLHLLKTQFGLELTMTADLKSVSGYNVVDDKKFTWFVLKWS